MRLNGNYLSIYDLAEKTGSSLSTVRQRIAKAKLPPTTKYMMYEEKSALKAMEDIPSKGRPKKDTVKKNAKKSPATTKSPPKASKTALKASKTTKAVPPQKTSLKASKTPSKIQSKALGASSKVKTIIAKPPKKPIKTVKEAAVEKVKTAKKTTRGAVRNVVQKTTEKAAPKVQKAVYKSNPKPNFETVPKKAPKVILLKASEVKTNFETDQIDQTLIDTVSEIDLKKAIETSETEIPEANLEPLD
jgi:hypothetical protein